MGLFSRKKETFACPVSGTLLNLENVPDEVFAKRMMGDGFAVDPTVGKIYAPVSGVIKAAFPTKHAIGIEAKDGTEILWSYVKKKYKLNTTNFLFLCNC